MARRNTKKQPEAHKIDCAEVFAALRDLEKTKGIPVRTVRTAVMSPPTMWWWISRRPA